MDAADDTISKPQTSLALLPGSLIDDRYRIVSELRHGGMGLVYRVEDIEDENELVVLKVLPSGARASVTWVRRFQREFRIVSTMAHPNVIRVFGMGHWRDLDYYTMELIGDGDLRDWVDRVRQAGWPPARADLVRILEVLAGIAGGLAYVHERGTVHRDLKPGNVLVDGDWPKLSDFGLAYCDTASGTRLTHTGLVLGSAPYMSPEQIRGGPLDLRTDLYSLGILIYELLAGTLPLRSRTALGWVHAHVYQIPRPLSDHAAFVDPRLCRLVDALLAKRPQDRPQQAREIWRELQRLASELGSGLGDDLSVTVDPAAAANQLFAASLIGRSEEQEAIRGGLAQLQNGMSGALAIHGVRGAGKSRLLEAVTEEAALRGAQVVTLAGTEGRSTPFFSLTRVLSEALDRLGREEIERRLTAGQRLLLAHRLPVLRPSLGLVQAPPPIAQHVSAESLRGAVAGLLIRAFGNGPLAILVDGVETVDSTSLAVLAQVARTGLAETARLEDTAPLPGRTRQRDRRRQRRGPQALFFALTVGEPDARMDLHEKLLALLDRLPAGCRRIRLEPLDVDGVAQLVEETLGLDHRPQPFAQRLYRDVGGNPLLVLQALRALIDSKQLARIDGDWVANTGNWGRDTAQAAADFDALQVPGGLEPALQARLEMLPPDKLRVLQAVAALAPGADEELVQRLSGLDAQQFDDIVTGLITAQLVVDTEPGVLSLVSEALVRAADETLAKAARRHLHLGAANLLEEQQAAGTAIDRLALARHWLASGNAEQALRVAFDAGEDARRNFLFDDADRYYAFFFEILPRRGGQNRRLRLMRLNALDGHGRCLHHLGRLEEAERLLEQLLELAALEEEIPWPTAPAKAQLAEIWFARGELERAMAAAVEAAELARRTSERVALGAALTTLGRIHAERGERREATEAFDQAVAVLEELDRHDDVAVILIDIGRVRHHDSDLRSAQHCYERALAMLERFENLPARAAAHLQLGRVLYELGQLGAADEHLQESLDLRRRTGERLGLADALDVVADVETARGRFFAALEAALDAEAIRRRMADEAGLPRTLLRLGRVRLELGQVEEARSSFRRVLRRADSAPDWTLALAHAGVAACALHRQELTEAEQAASEGLRLGKTSYVGEAAIVNRVALGVASALLENAERARSELAQALAGAEIIERRDLVALTHYHWARAFCHDPETALKHARLAIAAAAAHGSRCLLFPAHRLASEAARALGNHQLAAEHRLAYAAELHAILAELPAALKTAFCSRPDVDDGSGTRRS